MIILKQGRQPTLKMHAVLNGINFVYCMSYIYYLLSITKTSKVKIPLRSKYGPHQCASV